MCIVYILEIGVGQMFIIQLIFLQQYFSIPVPCNITRYCTARVLLHRPWGYVVSKQLRCALIRIDAFERRVTVWEETRRCSGMDNKHFITLVCMHIAMLTRVIRYIYIPFFWQFFCVSSHIYNSEGAYIHGIAFYGKCLQCNTCVSVAVVPSIKQPHGLVSFV